MSAEAAVSALPDLPQLQKLLSSLREEASATPGQQQQEL